MRDQIIIKRLIPANPDWKITGMDLVQVDRIKVNKKGKQIKRSNHGWMFLMEDVFTEGEILAEGEDCKDFVKSDPILKLDSNGNPIENERGGYQYVYRCIVVDDTETYQTYDKIQEHLISQIKEIAPDVVENK